MKFSSCIEGQSNFISVFGIWFLSFGELALTRTARSIGIEINNSTSRQGRPFVVKVPSTYCQIGSSSGECYLKSQCIDLGGKPIGTCYGGFGACCKFTFGCPKEGSHRTIREKTVTLKDTKNCRYVFKRPSGHCQIKLEIRSAFSRPTPEGECAEGSLTIINSVTVNNFRFCGSIEKALYATYDEDADIVLAFNSRRLNSNRNYHVKVTNIKCDARELVPSYCLMEYSENTGQVQSFGYDAGWIRGQMYHICIKKLASRIKWTKCDRSQLSFDNDGPIPSKDFILSKLYARFGSSGDYCREGTNYVSIFGNRYCGNYFPNEVTGKDEAFTLAVNFKGDDFRKVVEPMIFGPVNNNIGNCMLTHIQNSIVAFAVTCREIMTKAAPGGEPAEQSLNQCFCMKRVPPTEDVHESIQNLNIGFCLEYTQI